MDTLEVFDGVSTGLSLCQICLDLAKARLQGCREAFERHDWVKARELWEELEEEMHRLEEKAKQAHDDTDLYSIMEHINASLREAVRIMNIHHENIKRQLAG